MGGDVLDRVSALDLFADLPHRHLKHAAGLIEEQTVRAGAEIVREGIRSYDLYVIFSGTAEATVRGKRRYIYGPREFFGEVALLGHPQAATIVALDDMVLGRIEADAFRKLLDKEHLVAMHMVERLILRAEELFVRRAAELI